VVVNHFELANVGCVPYERARRGRVSTYVVRVSRAAAAATAGCVR
jgi:hypothetical protein